MTTKTCTKCKIIYDNPNKSFPVRKDAKDGLRTTCKKCNSDSQLIYKEKNIERIKETQKKWYIEHSEIQNAKTKQYYQDNKEKLLLQQKEYAQKNVEKRKNDQKLYKINNKEKIKDYSLKYYEKNKEIMNDKMKIYYEKNKEQLKEQMKDYRITNKKKIDEYQKKQYQENSDIVIEKTKLYNKNNKEKISVKSKSYRNNIAKYEIYNNKISYAEEIKKDVNGNLQVKCTYCDQQFNPTNRQVIDRLSVLNGNSKGESRFYCSDGCKQSCTIYRQVDYPKGFKKATSREVDPLIRKIALARDEYKCKKCFKTIDEIALHVHHIEGATQNPMISNDIDNVITYCIDCHIEIHKIEGCKNLQLQKCA